jgi:hypothetical protein
MDWALKGKTMSDNPQSFAVQRSGLGMASISKPGHDHKTKKKVWCERCENKRAV